MLENRNRTKKKKKMEKAKKKPIKIGFLKVVMQKCEKSKKWIFCIKLPDAICVRKGEKTRIFVHTICFGQKLFLGPKEWKPGKNYKNSGFSGNCPKPKMTHFSWKRCFLTWAKKVGFTNCVFEKLCFAEWVVFEHGKMVFWGFLFFLGFNVIVVYFWCVCHSCKSVKKCLFFSQFWSLLWGGLFLFIWVWKF